MIFKFRKNLLFIFLWLWLFPSCFSQNVMDGRIGFNIEGGKKKVQIKFENYNNLIIIPVLINGVLPVKFILDSGVSNSILTERSVSDFLSINYDRKVPLMGADGSKVIDAYVAANVSLRLPGVDSRGQAILVLAEDYLQLKNYLGVEVHGLIGYDIFSRFVVQINYDRTTITLINPSEFKPRKKDKEFAISIEDTRPYIQMGLTLMDGSELEAKMLMDTGASHSVLLDRESHQSINLPEKRIQGILGRGLGGDIEGFIGRVKHVSFFGYGFDQVIGSFPTNEVIGELFRKSSRQGTVGGGILSKFNVTIDYVNQKLYLRKGRKFKETFEYNMSGIETKAIGPKLQTFVIYDVRSDSPAERAGLLPGDQILHINGQNTSSLKLNEINAYFRSKEGRKIKLIVYRNGEKIKKSLILEKVI